MMSYQTARVIRVSVVVILMAALIIGVIFAVRAMLENSSETTRDTSRVELVATTPGRAVKMYVRGPIVAAEKFKAYTVEMTPQNRSLVVFSGYDGGVKTQMSADDTKAQYEQFVYALDHLEYMNGKELTGDANDTRGVCPAGYLYEFSILNNGDTLKKLWSTSCSNGGGSMSGRVETIKKLFLAQINGAGDAINNI